MSNRITRSDLNAVLSRMCRTMDIPEGPVWTRDESGQNRARVGALLLEPGSQVNGIGWKVAQMCNESGGERALLRGCTAAELYDAMQNFLAGYDAAKSRNA